MILSVQDISAGYGPAPVLRNVSFRQADGEILGVVGHNGMGKTTLLRVLAGLLGTDSGTILFAGQAVEGSPAHRRARLGIGYVPQGGLGFPSLTVAESLKLATAIGGDRRHRTIEETFRLFPRLTELAGRQSAALSGGEKQLLAMARAVIRSPRLLLLDELTEGVQPSAVEELAERLRTLHAQTGMSILVVDQDLAFVASLATRVLVMQKGRMIGDIAARELVASDVLGGFGTA